MNEPAPHEPQEPEHDDRRSRRKRLLASIGRIRHRVGQVCGVIDDANSLISRASDIASDIRSVLESPELRSLLPAGAQSGLSTAAGELQQVEGLLEKAGEKARIPADICSQVNEALDLAEAALQGPSQWGKIVERLIEAVAGTSVARRFALFVGGAVLAVLAAVGIWNALGGDSASGSPEDEVFGVYMLPPSFTLRVGETLDLGVRVEAEGGVDVSDRVAISWTVSDDSIGSISADGVLEGLSPGRVGVTVAAAGLADAQFFTVETDALPDLAVELNEPVFVDCVRGLCTHAITVLVRNDGEADAGRSTVTVELDGLLMAEELVGALASGDSAEVQLTFEPGGSCYDPDCAVVAVVDGTEQVEESDETDNTAEELFGG